MIYTLAAFRDQIGLSDDMVRLTSWISVDANLQLDLKKRRKIHQRDLHSLLDTIELNHIIKVSA